MVDFQVQNVSNNFMTFHAKGIYAPCLKVAVHKDQILAESWRFGGPLQLCDLGPVGSNLPQRQRRAAPAPCGYGAARAPPSHPVQPRADLPRVSAEGWAGIMKERFGVRSGGAV